MGNIINVLYPKSGGLKPTIRAVTNPEGYTILCDGQPGTPIQVLNPEWRNLPSGYTQVEWIKSDATQVIDTGILADSTKSIEVKFSNATISGNTCVFGASSNTWYGNNYTFNLCSNSDYYRMQFNDDSATGMSAAIKSGTLLADVTDNTLSFSIDGSVKKTRTSSFSTSLNFYIFGANFDTYHKSALAMHYCKIWNGNKATGTLVRDFVPCLNTSTSTYGLYDFVSNTFFTDFTGGNAFTAGSEVPQYKTLYTEFIVTIGTHTLSSIREGKTYTKDITISDISIYYTTLDVYELYYGDGSLNTTIGGYNGLLKAYNLETKEIEDWPTQSYSYHYGNFYADSGCNMEHESEDVMSRRAVVSGTNTFTFDAVTGDGLTTYQVHFGAGGYSGSQNIGNIKLQFDGTWYLVSEAVAANKIRPLVIIPQSWRSSGNCWQQILTLYNTDTTISSASYPESPWLIVVNEGVSFSGVQLYSGSSWSSNDGVRVHRWLDKTICLGTV